MASGHSDIGCKRHHTPQARRDALLDEIDEVARMIGAVNTIVNEGGKLFGLNTDGAGALKALRTPHRASGEEDCDQ